MLMCRSLDGKVSAPYNCLRVQAMRSRINAILAFFKILRACSVSCLSRHLFRKVRLLINVERWLVIIILYSF